jgi:hypothetical protein
MFEELPVLMLGAGTQHVVVLTSDSQDHQNFPQLTEEVLNYRLPPPPPKVKPLPELKAPKKVQQAHVEPMEIDSEEEKKDEDVVSTTSSKKRKRSEFEKETVLLPPMEAIVEKVKDSEKEIMKQGNVKRHKQAAAAADDQP